MNKLDLIFEKEPPEVQRKLMNLLIQYNAMMQYNPREDKFEVDLLLPFQTAKQKDEFIQNFKSRQHKRSRSIQAIHQQPQYTTNNKSSNLSEQQKKSQQLQRTMQKNSRKIDNQQKQKKQEQRQFGNQMQKERERERDREREDEQFSYQLTNENYDMSVRRQTISIRDVSNIIKANLQKAVKILAEVNRDNSLKVQQGQIKSETAKQNFSSSSIKLNRVQIDQQISRENSNPMILQGLEEIAHQNNENMGYIHDNEGNIIGREQFLGHNLPYQHRHQDLSSYNSSEANNKILIDDDNMHENDQQMNTDWKNERHENALTIAQQSKFKQPGQSIDRRQLQNNLSSQRQRIEQQKQLRQQEQQNSKRIKQKLAQKYSNNKKVNSSSIRQRYSDFLKKNHRDFNRIYETIRKQIKRNQSKLVKSRKHDPILVLEENISDTFSEQDRIFKEEVIKDYQRHIIAENQNMSSQDLIRYFRYLLQNAKNLYIKQLRKTK